MAYERIERQARNKTGPTLTIKRNGKMRLSADATKVLLQSGATRIALLWDKQKRKIGLQVAPEGDMGAFSLSYSKVQNSADFGARLFVRSIGIPLDSQNIDVALAWNEDEKMFEGRVPK